MWIGILPAENPGRRETASEPGPLPCGQGTIRQFSGGSRTLAPPAPTALSTAGFVCRDTSCLSTSRERETRGDGRITGRVGFRIRNAGSPDHNQDREALEQLAKAPETVLPFGAAAKVLPLRSMVSGLPNTTQRTFLACQT